ncbi:MAG: tetratricopeptide repeat protein [Candidatus Peregrinibacteria bacterium]|nr:tetratricopeptide repeat protein [Candidatus Peregrinibacteria bacterium]
MNQASTSTGSLRTEAFAALLVAAALLAFSPTLRADFVAWDDPQLILENPLIRNFSPRIFASFDPELYIPATLLTFQIEHAIAGFSATVFHTTNLLLHALNVILIFWLLTLLLKNRTAAFIGALLFAVHPLNAEAVSWVSARKELLMAAFSLGSLIAYVRSEGRSSRSLLVSLLLFALALLSKVTAITLPVLLLVIDWYEGRRISMRSILEKWPYFGLSAIFGIVALFGKSHTVSVLSIFDILLLAIRSTVFYLSKFFAPFNLSAIYPAPTDLTLTSGAQLLAIGILIVFLGITVALRHRIRGMSAGMLLFLIALIPSFLAYEKANEITLAADRYAYLPLVGLVLAIGALVKEIAPSGMARRAAILAALVLSSILGVLSWQQSQLWRSTETLFTNVLRVHPESAIAMNNIGFLRLTEGNIEEALPLFEEAVMRNPEYVDAYVNLGATYGRASRYDDAEDALKKALAIDPTEAQAHYNLAGVHQERANNEGAIQEYEKTIELRPSHAPAHYQLALLYLKFGREAEARATYEELLEIDPTYRGKAESLDRLLNNP